MPGLDFLKKKISEKKKEGEFASSELAWIEDDDVVDLDKVDQIVDNMKRKYNEEGVEFEEVSGRLKELRDIIAEGKTTQIEIQSVEDLQEVKDPIVKQLGSIYLQMRGFFEPIAKMASRLPQFEMLSFYLYSANMRYSAKQYLALSVVGATLVFIFAIILSSFMLFFYNIPLAFKILLVPLLSFVAALFSLIIFMLVPNQKAKARGNAVSIELPFALRHMATELKAGIGLYRTIQAIATSDYGVLSEEFARTINEIEEGTDTKDALRHLALRTQSKALRNTLMHVIRAIKTGGNLSNIMNDIAEDVAFELRMSTRDFSAKMNFFGVIFIFSAIVMPVVVAILGGIRNSPLGEAGGIGFKEFLPLTPEIIAVIYLVVMPLLLGLFIYYIRAAQPKV